MLETKECRVVSQSIIKTKKLKINILRKMEIKFLVFILANIFVIKEL